MTNVEKYLSRWAEPESRQLPESLPKYDAGFTVPALGEPSSLLDGYTRAAAAENGRVLLVLVVNASPESAAGLRQQNRDLLNDLRASATIFDDRRFLSAARGFDVLVVDRSDPEAPIPRREGVGLARKIGGDILLSLVFRGTIRAPTLFFTDADAELPEDYFARAGAAGAGSASARIYPFSHVAAGDADAHRATMTYEAMLRYHVLGLASAGSPYAYHSIGSTLSVRAEAYAAVRGVPRRAAGEDFYLLDKLAKIGPVERLGGAPVAIRARRSLRVPFGTGPRVEKILGAGDTGVCAPQAFRALGAVLSGIDQFASTRQASAFEGALQELQGSLRDAAHWALRESGVREAAEAALAEVGAGSLRRRLHTWFDALKTLRFLHALEAAGLADRPLADAMAEAAFLGGVVGGRPDDLARELAVRERLLPVLTGPALYD